MLDPKSKEILEDILSKDIAELVEEDKGFLCARVSYLNEEQRERYASILSPEPEEKPLAKMSKTELQAKATELELSTEGTAKELIAAIEAKLAE